MCQAVVNVNIHLFVDSAMLNTKINYFHQCWTTTIIIDAPLIGLACLTNGHVLNYYYFIDDSLVGLAYNCRWLLRPTRLVEDYGAIAVGDLQTTKI